MTRKPVVFVVGQAIYYRAVALVLLGLYLSVVLGVGILLWQLMGWYFPLSLVALHILLRLSGRNGLVYKSIGADGHLTIGVIAADSLRRRVSR